jgi:hypothetical protein
MQDLPRTLERLHCVLGDIFPALAGYAKLVSLPTMCMVDEGYSTVQQPFADTNTMN